MVIYSPVDAAATSEIVITHIQTGGVGSGTAGQEFVAIANASTQDINVSGWCIKYSDYTYSTFSDLYCFNVAPDSDEVHIAAKSHAVIISHTYPTPLTNVTGLFTNTSSSLSSTRGHIVLRNALNEPVDIVAWDNKAAAPPVKPETLAAPAPAGGSMLTRIVLGDTYTDTDNNSLDFKVNNSVLPTAAPLIDYSIPTQVIDLCGTIDGIQEILPVGYDFDEAGNCEYESFDLCKNIIRIQLVVPENTMQYEGNCLDLVLDVCKNIDGFQLDIPTNYRVLEDNLCKLILPKSSIFINEVLPNANGVDTGKEFIELYNSGEVAADLSDYYLLVGKQLEKRIQLPTHTLGVGGYVAFTDEELGFTLLNTTTNIRIVYYDGSLVNEMIPYENPGDDISWSRIDGIWQYTNNPTPKQHNKSATEVLSTQTEIAGVIACPAGKYRNPLTNRCRNIEEDVSVLGSCDGDEYRNPETNRCRKISTAASSLAPCESGYERNEETNRCRKIVQETSLTPCAEGYERNPETNRCRKALSNEVLASAVEEVADPQNQMNMYPLLTAAAAGGFAYGVYEWRVEARAILRRMLDYFQKK
ncbi:MAG: lamin tail domain-containing protein [Candidatus Saccharimonadales bacterium]